MLALAQSPVLKRYANGTDIGQAVMAIGSTHRITLVVEDGLPRDVGYVYEFGPVNVYRLDAGGRVLIQEFRGSEVMNAPVLTFAFGPQQNPDLIGNVEFEVAWIKRYDLNNNVETLPIAANERIMRFSVQP